MRSPRTSMALSKFSTVWACACPCRYEVLQVNKNESEECSATLTTKAGHSIWTLGIGCTVSQTTHAIQPGARAMTAKTDGRKLVAYTCYLPGTTAATADIIATAAAAAAAAATVHAVASLITAGDGCGRLDPCGSRPALPAMRRSSCSVVAALLCSGCRATGQAAARAAHLVRFSLAGRTGRAADQRGAAGAAVDWPFRGEHSGH